MKKRSPFEVNCRVCGKAFKAKHPEKAAFCSAEHHDEWFKRIRRQRKAS
jgi:hypothetical protein